MRWITASLGSTEWTLSNTLHRLHRLWVGTIFLGTACAGKNKLFLPTLLLYSDNQAAVINLINRDLHPNHYNVDGQNDDVQHACHMD